MKILDLILKQSLKRLICLVLVFTFSSSPINAKKLLKGNVDNYETELEGFNIKLIPETLLDTNLNIEGDFFSALLTKPSAELLRVPKGSRLLGEISEIHAAKSLKRSGKIKAAINQLMLPDGSIVKVSATLSSKASLQNDDKPKNYKSLAKKFARTSTEVTTSSLVGAVDSVQYLGLGTAIATSGLSVATGAALGLGLGITGAFTSKGQELINSGFNAVNFKLESDFIFLEEIPLQGQSFQAISASLLGINLKLKSIEKYYSKSYGEFLVFDIEVNNASEKKINAADFVLTSSTHIRPIFNNPLLTGELYKNIKKSETDSFLLAFSLGSIKKKDDYQLMLVNPISQEIIADLEVDFSSYL